MKNVQVTKFEFSKRENIHYYLRRCHSSIGIINILIIRDEQLQYYYL